MNTEVELLAPAGSFEALKAAVQNGADAVYLGGTDFGARAYASNFNRETLKEAIAYAHIRGTKVYVTVNTLVKDGEIHRLLEYVHYLYSIDADAVIVQDLGVLYLIREHFPDFEVHCSTQMTLHNTQGVNMLRQLGVQRVVLARELSLKEIKEIYQNTGIELEVFVHGALCVSYSGQCLMSSFIGGRSGNRGRCAQPCRKLYNLVSLKEQQDILENRAFHISMRDLNTLERLGELIEVGVSSFKIEGRMKKPQYVASIVSAYRKAIDTYLIEKKAMQDEKLQKEVEQMFNRRFTQGYLFETAKKDMVNIEKSNNRGLFLGKVKDYDTKKGRFTIVLQNDLARGDGIEVWGKDTSDIGGNIIKMYVHNRLLENAKKGQMVEIELKGHIKKGDEVYKTLDLGLMKTLEKTYQQNVENKKVQVEGEIKIQLGKPLQLYLWDFQGNSVYIESEAPVEKAIHLSLSSQKVLESMKKLGNTPYVLKSLKVDMEEGLAVPLAMINSLRRDAIEKLTEKRKNRNKREAKPWVYFRDFANYESYERVSGDNVPPKVTVKVDQIQLLRAVLEEKVHRIYYGDLQTLSEAIALCKGRNVEIYLKSTSILKDEEMKKLKEKIVELELDGILAGDLGMIGLMKKDFPLLPIICDFPLNIMNSYTARLLEKSGVQGVTLSPELDIKSIKEMHFKEGLEVEGIIYGKLPAMTMEYCPLTQGKYCNHQCTQCTYYRYQYQWGLKDVKNMVFPFTKDTWGRTIILNSQPIFMLDRLNDLMDLNIHFYRFELSDEEPVVVKKLFRALNQELGRGKKQREKKQSSLEDFKKLLKGGFTRGHYYRGVE